MTEREGYQPGGICRYVPDREKLDEYQHWTSSTLIMDEGGRTLRGKDPFIYMHDGVAEELGELWQADTINRDYNRLGMLLGNNRTDGGMHMIAGNVTPHAIELHQKEFGDVSWYMANRLKFQNVIMSETIEPGIDLRNTDARETPGCCPEFIDFAEEMFPGAMLLGYGHAFERASYEAMEDGSTKNIDRLSATAGRLILSMNQFLHRAFDISYEAVLDQNIAKLTKRMQNGTIHDRSGGDVR